MQIYSSSILAAYSSIFMLLIPLVTYFRYVDNPDISKLIVLFMINLSSIALYLMYYISSEIRFNARIIYSSSRLTFLAILSFIPLVMFVRSSMGGYEFEYLSIFSESYRQSEFAGSGVYTIWITQIIPAVILLILICNGWSWSLVIPILLVVLASLILGLRVYLWGIFFGLFLQISKGFSFSKAIFAIFAIFLLVIYKLFLLPDESIDIHELFLKQIVRPDLHAIVKNDLFSDDLIKIFEYFPVVRYYYGHGVVDFKDYYVPTIQNINILMPYKNLNSGVALPAYVVNFNIFNVFSLITNVLLMTLIYKMIKYLSNTRSIFMKVVLVFLIHILTISLFEDVGGFYKIEELVFVVPIAYLFLMLITKKKARSTVVIN